MTPRSAAAALLLALLAAGGASAQTSPAESSSAPPAVVGGPAAAAEGGEDLPGRIDGFWGLGWHADSAAVAAALGPPITVGRGDDGLRFFVYTPWHMGRDGFLQLWLYRDFGLVGGSWEPIVSDCSGTLRRLVQATKATHPDVSSRTEGAVTRDMLGGDICEAAVDEDASVTVVWEGAGGTEIRIGTTPGSPRLRIRAVTPLLRFVRPQGI